MYLQELKKLTENYMQHGETPFIVEIITEMTSESSVIKQVFTISIHIIGNATG